MASVFRVDILSARAAWLGAGWGRALECSSEYLCCFRPDCPCSSHGIPRASEGSCGQEAGERDKPVPCFEEAGPYAHFGGPRSGPSPSAGRLGCAESRRGRKESGSEAGPRHLRNNEQAPIHPPLASPSHHPHQALPPPLAASAAASENRSEPERKRFWQRTSCCGRSEPLMDGAARPLPPGQPALRTALRCPKHAQWGPGLAASGCRQKENTADFQGGISGYQSAQRGQTEADTSRNNEGDRRRKEERRARDPQWEQHAARGSTAQWLLP